MVTTGAGEQVTTSKVRLLTVSLNVEAGLEAEVLAGETTGPFGQVTDLSLAADLLPADTEGVL